MSLSYFRTEDRGSLIWFRAIEDQTCKALFTRYDCHIPEGDLGEGAPDAHSLFFFFYQLQYDFLH